YGQCVCGNGGRTCSTQADQAWSSYSWSLRSYGSYTHYTEEQYYRVAFLYFRFPIANFRLMLSRYVFPIGNRQLEIGNTYDSFIQRCLKPCRLRPCGRLHESRTAIPFP